MSESKKTAPQSKGGDSGHKHSGASKDRLKWSPLPGVSMLRLGDRSSLMRVKAQLANYFRTQYGDEAVFMVGNGTDYYTVPEADIAEINAIEGLTNPQKNACIEKEITFVRSLKRTQQKERRQMFGQIMQVLDNEGMDSVEISTAKYHGIGV